jgi:cytochrome P450
MATMTARHPPGPKGHWLWGSLPEFRRDSLAFYTRCARDYGDVIAFRFGPRRAVLLTHPDLVEQVLVVQNRNFVKHFGIQLLRPLLGNGLLLSEGDFWLRQRRLVQPAFLRQRFDGYGAVMVEHSLRLLDGWRDGETRDIHRDMMGLALGIAAKTLLDADVTGAAAEVGHALDQLMNDFIYRFGSAFPVPAWLPTPNNRRRRQAMRRLDWIINGIIRQRRQAGGDRGDLLSMLMRARDEGDGTGMTDQQLRDEVMTLFLAGHETTANALTWTWYLLAQHPKIEVKLLAELRDVLGDRPPTVADLPRLRYAEWVVHESMRLYPPVVAFGRQAVERCEIGGYEIPAGGTVIMSQWVVHHDARFFDNPNEFQPERWDNDLIHRLPKFAYFPFGGGPRVCIGNTFALMELVLVLATIAPRYRFQLVPGHPVKPFPSVTLRPAHGVQVVLCRR